jgi:hypothetical protein
VNFRFPVHTRDFYFSLLASGFWILDSGFWLLRPRS